VTLLYWNRDRKLVVAGTSRRRRTIVAKSSAVAPEVLGIAEADAVREQVAHRQLAGHVGVGELQLRQVFLHRIVERHPAAVGEHGDEHGGERLGGGHVAEPRVHRDGIGFAQLADAVTLDEEDRIVFHDHDGESGHAPVGHRPGDVGVETGQGPLLGRAEAKPRHVRASSRRRERIVTKGGLHGVDW